MTGTPLYLGIDPGVNGGIAALTACGRAVEVHKMPETEKDVCDLLRAIADSTLDEFGTYQIHGALEHVNAGLFGGKAGKMGVSSAFTFGKGYGLLRGVLLAHGIAFEDVRPQAWQMALSCRSKGDKNITKSKAQQLFPTVKVTHALADALLIAEYCRRLRVGIQRTTSPERMAANHV